MQVYLLRPPYIEHLEIIFNDADLFFLMGLVEVLEDDGYVHVNDDHVADDDKRREVRDGQQWAPTVAVLARMFPQLAFRRLDHEGL